MTAATSAPALAARRSDAMGLAVRRDDGPLRASRPIGASTGVSRRRFLTGTGAAVAGLAGVGLWLGFDARPPDVDVLVMVEKTTRSPGLLAASVRARLLEIAQAGGGRLSPFAVGEKVAALRPVSLAVEQQGEVVHDPDRLAAAVGHRLDAVVADLARAPVGRQGLNLVTALKTIADASRTVDRLEAWLQTTVLTSSADPLLLAALLAAEPQAAVDQVKATSLGRLDLSRVELHLVLVPPSGDDQPPLSVRADEWREAFLTQLAAALGADVAPSVHDDTTAAAWAGASVAQVIRTSEDATPTVPTRPLDPDGGPPIGVDTAAFRPDTADLLEPAAVVPKLRQVAERYHAAAGRFPIACTGYCARFGDAAGARALSAQRAAVIARLLVRGQGIPEGDVHAAGVGFDERADPAADPRSPAQRVVLMRLVPRGSGTGG